MVLDSDLSTDSVSYEQNDSVSDHQFSQATSNTETQPYRLPRKLII
ncbi:hypothetical protein ICE98_03029 [Lactococcus lactis]|nr:hypothetical protein [Lactococcus lactis]